VVGVRIVLPTTPAEANAIQNAAGFHRRHGGFPPLH
jgi:hypothetical protein